MITAVVILEGQGGELDRACVSSGDVNIDMYEARGEPCADEAEALSVAIKLAIDEWVLAPGDTIRIVEDR